MESSQEGELKLDKQIYIFAVKYNFRKSIYKKLVKKVILRSKSKVCFQAGTLRGRPAQVLKSSISKTTLV